MRARANVIVFRNRVETRKFAVFSQSIMRVPIVHINYFIQHYLTEFIIVAYILNYNQVNQLET